MNIFILAMVLLFAGCTKKPRITVTGDVPQSLTEESEGVNMPDPNETIINFDEIATVCFGFDSYALREMYKVAAVGEYMKKTGAKVFLSGFASEEGSDEYNLALGARRAQSVRDYLESYGVPVESIAWQSFGEENPVTTDPAKMEMNRRVEISIEGVEK